MIVILENFRQHTNATFNLPNIGTLLLRGNNGTGKSNMLKSIMFCLYGYEGSKNIISFGKTNVSVTIIMDEITIKRSKPPNKLFVEYKNIKYNDEVAQGIINNFFGVSEQLFMLGSYITNRHKLKSIICLSSTETRTVLEELAQKQKEYEIRDKLKIFSKNIKTEFHTINSKKIAYEDLLKNMVLSPCEPPKKFVDSIEEEQEALKDFEKKIMEYENMISIHNNADAKIKELESQKSILDNEYIGDELLKTTKMYKEYIEQKECIEKRISSLQQKILKKPELVREKIGHLSLQLSEKTRIADSLKKICKRLDVEYEDPTDEFFERIKEYFFSNFTCSKIHKCPFCNNKVQVGEGGLEKPTDDKEKIVIRKKDYNEIKTFFENTPMEIFNAKKEDYDRLYKKLRDHEMATIELSKIKTERYLFLEKLFCDQGEYDISIIEEQESLSKKIATISASIKTLQKQLLPSLDKIIMEKNKLEKRLKKMDKDIIENYKSTILYNEYIKKLDEKKKLEKEVELFSSKIADLVYKQNMVENILKKVMHAGNAILDAVLEMLNYHAKFFLEKIFDYEIKAEIKKERERLYVQIEKNGQIVGYDFLGDGEKQRLELAFCLSINIITNSKKILMFDESFGAVHPEVFVTCMGILRDYAIENHKLVVVVSHNQIDGIFDNIITLQ